MIEVWRVNIIFPPSNWEGALVLVDLKGIIPLRNQDPAPTVAVLFLDCSSLVSAFPQVALVVKNPPASAGDIRDVGLSLGLGRSPGEGHGNPLQNPFLGNPMDRSLAGCSP